MNQRFKSTWMPVPRSDSERWKRGVIYEFAILPEEIDGFGIALEQRFPGSVIYPSRLRTEPTRLSGFFHSLREAGQAANSASAHFRQPWPDDTASGDERRLVSYREELLGGGHDAFRRMGRCLHVSWWTGRTPILERRFKERRNNEMLDCEFYFIASSMKVNFIYDCDDPEVVLFLRDLEAFLLEITTCDFASYDPCTHEVINPKRRDASQRRSVGVVRHASLHDRIYFDYCHREGKPPEVMGPRPEIRAAFRREAGLEA
ncbi:hypothetical protein [Dongia sp.]|uniref:hypothetical protein n=1 Tax=Dongia sp. TaxID=1977262 RepID=UPI0035B0606D